MRNSHTRGFTLAELLIALLILAEIATFTIPKILNSQRNGQSNAVTKETVAMVSAAYSQLQLTNGTSASTSMAELTQYMNYVAVTSNTYEIDTYPTQSGPLSCDPTFWRGCLKLHNGAVLWYSTIPFGSTNPNTAVAFAVDADGILANSGTTTGSSKSVVFYLGYNGRIVDGATLLNDPAVNPNWFSW